MRLTAVQRDRAAGVLLATAAGDALGAPFEFGPPQSQSVPVEMTGGGPWSAGEWTDDTAMAIAIAEVAADGLDLRSAQAQDRIVARWYEWARGAKDAGIQTRAVLAATGPTGGASTARSEAQALHRRTGRSGGNGSLMRTAPVAVAYLGDLAALIEAATSLSTLTHFDPEAAEACVLWCLAIRHAVLTGELNVRVGLDSLTEDRAQVWRARIDVAEVSTPADFDRNGWVVEAFQAAWCAIATTPMPADDPASGTFRADHLQLALKAAVRGGRDADTVAAITGGLLGAAYGASAVPWSWRRLLHGWPDIGAPDLVNYSGGIERGGARDTFDFGYRHYPRVGVLGRHPHDDGVLLGGVAGLDDLPPDVNAVVSLCRVERPSEVAVVVQSRLIDAVGENAHVDFALHDAVDAVIQLRAEGRTVYLHCVQAHSRTPAVAALYGMRLRGVSADQALSDICRVLPSADPNSDFRAALSRAQGPPEPMPTRS
jgi:ADP-ribosyl-[dinitrogen reductase] hydrolase